MITGKVNGTVGFLCSTVPAIIILIYLIRSIDLLKIFRKEFATTLKVMRAFPENKLDFSPHERSSKAKSIMSTFIFEMYLMELNVFGKKIENSTFQTYSQDNLQKILEDFENESKDVVSNL